MDVKGTRVLVVGLARSGFAVARALARRGAVVTVTDLKPPSAFRELLPQLLKEKIGVELGSQRQETFLRHDLIVVSPGVPWDLAQLQAARRQRIPVYPEVELATWFLEGTLVGVTGSNGKTTTTALLGDMLRASGFPVFVGGNIGNALSLAIDATAPGTFFVTELSSFQLEGIQELRPHVAVILNLSPNHLDRHPSLEAYAQAKRQILRNQHAEDIAVLNADDAWVSSLQTGLTGHPLLFSRQRELPNGLFVSSGQVYYRVRHLERVLFETRDVMLRGAFNLENVLAAAAAACALGANFTAIRTAIRDFRAVEHRLEFVREIKGVDYYNNSKATSVDATLKSLEAFERGVHLILGGKDKGAPYTPLIPLIKERVRDVLLIGAAAPVITRDLAGSVELVPCGDLATALREAFRRARPGDTVLLAPACSSFDQFRDYEERGRVFKDLVGKLAWEVSPAAQARQRLHEVDSAESSPTAMAVPAPLTPPVIAPEVQSSGAAPQPQLETAAVETETGPATGSPDTEVTSLPAQEEEEAPAPESPPPVVAAPPEQVDSDTERVPSREPTDDQNVEAERDVIETAGSTELPPVSSSDAPPLAGHEAEPQSPTPHRAELTYVYEVDVEETPPGEIQLAPEGEIVAPEAREEAEVASDEPLPFEVRTAGGTGKSVRPRRRSRARTKSGDGPPEPQSQLPGMD